MTLEYWNKTYNHEQLSQRELYVWRNNFLSNIVKINNITSILELGCSIGGVLEVICRNNPNVNVCGLDFCNKAIDIAKVNFPFPDRATFVRGDLNNINALSQFRDKSFDLVFSCGALIYCHPKVINFVSSGIVRVSKKFIIHVERQGKDGLLARGDKKQKHPDTWTNNYAKRYGRLGYNPRFIDLQSLVPEIDIARARHIVWVNLQKENKMILGI